MSGPLDNPLSDADPRDAIPDGQYPPQAGLPMVYKGRMFCIVHGRQCYRSAGLAGENVWICPDERHLGPIA